MRGHLWTVIALAGCGCVSSAEPRGTMSAEGVGCSALISVLSMSTSDALLAMLGGYAVARSRSSGLAAYVPAMLAVPLVFGAGAEAAVGTVKSYVKISSTAGGLAASSLGNTDEFGRSIASIADMDGDGVPELAVGAQKDDDGGSNLGAVYILFMNSTGTVKSQQKISQLSGSLDSTFVLPNVLVLNLMECLWCRPCRSECMDTPPHVRCVAALRPRADTCHLHMCVYTDLGCMQLSCVE